jgi:hypothetical protein
MEVSHEEDSYCCRCPKPGRDIIASNDIWLFVGWEGKDGNPSGENVGESIHLSENVSSRLKTRGKVPPTKAPTYARFSGSCLFTSFTQVQVIPADVPLREVRSR